MQSSPDEEASVVSGRVTQKLKINRKPIIFLIPAFWGASTPILWLI